MALGRRVLVRANAFVGSGTDGRLFLVVVGPLFLIYAATASWWFAASPDSFTNLTTANAVATQGTVFLDESARLTELGNYGQWIVPARDGRIASKYQPATALHAAPAYLLVAGQTRMVDPRPLTGKPPGRLVDYRVPPAWPAALTAAGLASLGMGFLAVTFAELVDRSLAVTAALVAGLGTSVWSVAADELWQHTPGVFWMAVAGFALARGRASPAALAYAVTVAVRPVNAIVGGAVALRSLLNRTWNRGVVLAAGVGFGVTVVIAVNFAVFGEMSIQGGYSGDWVGRPATRSVWWFTSNYAFGLLHPRYGLLVWSPFLVPLLIWAPSAWRSAPEWVRGPAVGGLTYLVAQWSLNRASGGSAFFFYRYPLESLIAAGPFLLWVYVDQIRTEEGRHRVFGRCLLVAMVAHLIGALTLR